ncbi:MAG TPA: HNH endonuclease signature motif containing protein, partial [Acidimicrobiia bacterium]|nr:HNH endonuclease signature motif containing protein [Acidimicrobiia bacterium]
DAFEGETCEIQGVGPVSVEWVRSILGEAFLTAIIKKGTDIKTVAHFGRNVPELVQTAKIVSGHECEAEDCEIHGYLERDHVHDYALGGVTSLANLIWLCYFHNRLKSRGWILGPPDPETGKRKLFPPNSQVA